MAVSLVCPSCGAAISAPDSDRGKSTLCGSCWTEVPVPAASGPAKSAPVAARPVGAAPVAATPAVAKPAVAKPVAAAPAKAAPVAPVSKDDDLDLDLPSPRSRRRPRDDEDDEDDRPEPSTKKKGGNSTLLIILGVVAFVLLLGCGGIGYVIYDAVNSAKKFADDFSQPPDGWDDVDMNDAGMNANNPGIGGVTQSTTNAIPKGNWEKKWNQIAGDGFAAYMPDAPRPNNRNLLLDSEELKGARYESDEGGVTFNVLYFDLPNELAFDAGQFVDKSRPSGGRYKSTFVKQISIANYPGSEFTRPLFGTETETILIVKVGPRVFQFFTHHDPRRTIAFAGQDPEAKKKQFFDSVSISYNPNTPAPPSSRSPKKQNPKTNTPSPTPKNPPTTVNPKLPTFPPTFPPLPPQGDPTTTVPQPIAPPTTNEAFKAVGRVDQFLTAVVLPEKKEILTFANRGPVGLVRRISPSTYKTIAERVLPSPVIHAVADERNGRLYVATVKADTLIGMEPTNRLTATGDIQVFDLAAVLSDEPAKGDLKPLASAGLSAKIVGLELGPKGKTLYAATVFLDKGKARANTTTLVLKFDAADLKKLGEHDVANPLGTIRLSPDGKYLYAAEFPYNSFGSPQYGSSTPVAVHIYDAVTWRKAHTINAPHPVVDLQFLSDDKALVVMGAGLRVMKLHTLDTKGESVDVTPDKARHHGGYAAVSPDGKKVILSGRPLPGMEVFSLEGGKLRPLGYTQIIGGGARPVGPIVVLDEKTAMFGSGAVVDFSAVGK